MKRQKEKEKTRVRRSATTARDLIVETALECFASTGFYETSFQKIADSCGMSQTAVLYHFKSKNDLLKAVLSAILVSNSEEVTKLVAREKSAEGRLKAHFEGNLRWALKHRNEAKNILLLYYYATFSPEFSEIYAPIRKAAAGKILEHLSAAMGETRADLEALSFLAHDALLGGIVNCLAVGGSSTAQRKCRESWACFFLLIITE